jgi:hypothetical protein
VPRAADLQKVPTIRELLGLSVLHCTMN